MLRKEISSRFTRSRAPGSRGSISSIGKVSLYRTATPCPLSSHILEKALYPNLLKVWFSESELSIHS